MSAQPDEDSENEPKLCCGIIGWSEPTLRTCGRFFPSSSSCRTGSDRLRFVASKFPCVEVDTSHYAVPTERVVKEWLLATRDFDQFKFHVKVFGMFTLRRVPFGTLPFQVRNIMDALRPRDSQSNIRWEDLTLEARKVLWDVQNARLQLLHDAGRLGCVVFQFQLDFSPSDACRDWIEYCRKNLGTNFTMAVEFRDRKWYRFPKAKASRASPDRTVLENGTQDPLPFTGTTSWLRSLEIVQVVVDELDEELYRKKESGEKPLADSSETTGEASTASTGQVPGLAATQLAIANPNFVYVRVHRRSGSERLLGATWHSMWANRIKNSLIPSIMEVRKIAALPEMTGSETRPSKNCGVCGVRSSLCSDSNCKSSQLCKLCQSLSNSSDATAVDVDAKCHTVSMTTMSSADVRGARSSSFVKASELGKCGAPFSGHLNPRSEIHFVFGTAFEDQSVRNAENLYSACGVNVNSTWRAGHRKRAIAGFFGPKIKASSSAPPKKSGAAAMEQELPNGSHDSKSSPAKPVAQKKLNDNDDDDNDDLSIVDQLFVDSDDDSDPKDSASLALENADDDDDEVVILGSNDDSAGAGALSQASPGMAGRATSAGQTPRSKKTPLSIAERFELRRAMNQSLSETKKKRRAPKMSIAERFAAAGRPAPARVVSPQKRKKQQVQEAGLGGAEPKKRPRQVQIGAFFRS